MAQPLPLRVPQSQSLPLEEPAQNRLIVALDQDTEGNKGLVDALGSLISFYKLGSVSLFSGGIQLLDSLLDQGKRVFLDLKIFDVPETVQNTMAKIAELGVRFATVHGTREIIESAIRGRDDADLKILAVTALTSLSARDVRELYDLPNGITLEEYVIWKARVFAESGCDGVIASPREVRGIRESDTFRGMQQKLLIVAPGIRMPGDPLDDQVRIGRPRESIRDGADYLVMGRTIYNAENPVAKAEQVIGEIQLGLRDRES